MNLINLTSVNLNNALRISSENSPRQLLRFGLDRYVVLTMDPPTLILAIESKKLSDLINTLTSVIEDVKIFAMWTIFADASEQDEDSFEIRMYFNDGKCLAFNSNEESYTIEGPPTESIVEQTSSPASDYWRLANRLPFNQLLVTPNFAQWVLTEFGNGDPTDFLDRCWYDFQQIKRGSCMIHPGKPMRIDGEFGTFYAAEYLCGRVCFQAVD